MTFLTLLLSPISKAFAQDQDTRSYTERRGFQTYQPPTENATILNIPSDNFRVANTSNANLSPSETTRVDAQENTTPTTGQSETIVVTAQRRENFRTTERPEFDAGFLERNGITSQPNPDLAGLPFLTPEERREGWSFVRIPAFGSTEGESGPFLEAEGGRGHGLRAGVRF